MAVDHIETYPLMHTIRPAAAILRSSARRGVAAETSAHKLRAQGLSYRRIAVELRVRYDQVSRWLSSCAPAAFVADTAAARPFSEQGVDGLSQPAGRVPAGDLTDRVNDLMATLRQVSRESREREEKLYRIIEVERAAAREQAARRDAELDQLRSVVDKLAERVARLDAPEPSAWRRVWRQGAGR